jgi:hypothetical protein
VLVLGSGRKVPKQWELVGYCFGIEARPESFRKFPNESRALVAAGRRDVALLAHQRAQRKKFIPARLAAQRGNPEHPPEYRGHSRNVLARNPLQFQVPASPAVRIKKIVQRLDPCAKSRFAPAAAPRQNSRQPKEMVLHRPTFGSPGIRDMTDRARDRAGSDGRSPPQA